MKLIIIIVLFCHQVVESVAGEVQELAASLTADQGAVTSVVKNVSSAVPGQMTGANNRKRFKVLYIVF
jgi:hypothetical protein